MRRDADPGGEDRRTGDRDARTRVHISHVQLAGQRQQQQQQQPQDDAKCPVEEEACAWREEEDGEEE